MEELLKWTGTGSQTASILSENQGKWMKVQAQTNEQPPQHQELPVSPVLSTSCKKPTIFIGTFLTSGEFIWLEFGSGQGWWLYIFHQTLSGLVTFQYQKHAQQYASGKTLEKKIYILFFNMQVEFVLSVSGGINPSQGKLVTWYCLVKSKLSPEIHLESTNNINGWIKNQ